MSNSNYAQVVAVCGRSNVKKMVSRSNSTALVSLLDRDKRVFTPPRVECHKHLRLFVDDVTDPAAPDAPNVDHARLLLRFFRSLAPSDRVTVHCEAGISRSTATALAFLALASDPRTAEDQLFDLRPVASPNSLLTRHFDDTLGLNGALVASSERLRGRCALDSDAGRTDLRRHRP